MESIHAEKSHAPLGGTAVEGASAAPEPPPGVRPFSGDAGGGGTGEGVAPRLLSTIATATGDAQGDIAGYS